MCVYGSVYLWVNEWEWVWVGVDGWVCVSGCACESVCLGDELKQIMEEIEFKVSPFLTY